MKLVEAFGTRVVIDTVTGYPFVQFVLGIAEEVPGIVLKTETVISNQDFWMETAMVRKLRDACTKTLAQMEGIDDQNQQQPTASTQGAGPEEGNTPAQTDTPTSQDPQ